MEHLHSKGYDVTLYSSLYLKSARKVLELLDDGRRTLPATKQHILETFDNIKDIVEKAQEYGFSIENDHCRNKGVIWEHCWSNRR